MPALELDDWQKSRRSSFTLLASLFLTMQFLSFSSSLSLSCVRQMLRGAAEALPELQRMCGLGLNRPTRSLYSALRGSSPSLGKGDQRTKRGKIARGSSGTHLWTHLIAGRILQQSFQCSRSLVCRTLMLHEQNTLHAFQSMSELM